MNLPDREVPLGSDEPLDDLDTAILGEIRSLFDAADPVPAGLVERVQFALALEEIDIEVMRLCEEVQPTPAGARSAEECRTITFDSDSLTVMISIRPDGPGTVRLDGWLAPPARLRVELKTADGRYTTDADDQGRFVLDGIRHGLGQVIVHTQPSDPPGSPRAVVTPSIMV